MFHFFVRGVIELDAPLQRRGSNANLPNDPPLSMAQQGVITIDCDDLGPNKLKPAPLGFASNNFSNTATSSNRPSTKRGPDRGSYIFYLINHPYIQNKC